MELGSHPGKRIIKITRGRTLMKWQRDGNTQRKVYNQKEESGSLTVKGNPEAGPGARASWPGVFGRSSDFRVTNRYKGMTGLTVASSSSVAA